MSGDSTQESDTDAELSGKPVLSSPARINCWGRAIEEQQNLVRRVEKFEEYAKIPSARVTIFNLKPRGTCLKRIERVKNNNSVLTSLMEIASVG